MADADIVNSLVDRLKLLGITSQPRMTKVKDLWSPYSSEVYPSADVLKDEYTLDVPGEADFPGGFGSVLWNDPRINSQSQIFAPVNPSSVGAGVRNHPTARTYGGGVLDISFQITDDRMAFMTQVFQNMDTSVYVSDDNGRMRRLKSRPLVFTPNSNAFAFRMIKFASKRSRTIRYVGPFVTFYQILVSTNAVVRRPPDKDLILSVSDSFRESQGSYNLGSSETYHTWSINDHITMATGLPVARLGLGGTGWFNNASGTASNSPGPDGSVPFFSDANVACIKAYGKNKIRIVDVNGTINDGELSGGKAGMKARAIEGLNKIYTWDRGIRFVIWGPEPFNNSSTPGSVHDLNRQALIEVAAEHPAVIGYLDTNNPVTPFYSGLGSEAAPVAGSSQSMLTGFDTIHPNALGTKHYWDMAMAEYGDFEIEAEREQVEP